MAGSSVQCFIKSVKAKREGGGRFETREEYTSVAKVGVVIGDLNSPTPRKRTPRIPHTVHGTVRHFKSLTDALLL